MARVQFDHVKKVYDGGFVALHDLSLTIDDGEFVVLVGPSGCGKSTTLRIVAGLEEATEGTISIDGRVVNDVSPKDRDIAMVFQNYALYPHMTVFENMSFGLKLRKTPKGEIRQRVEQAAQLLGIEDLLERKPKALSGGQRQRVAVGRAIVRQPKVFLFDEPLSNLDAKLRVQMRTEISRLHRQLGATMIYVTHDQTEAMTMADRIVLMKDGHVHQVGTPMEIYGSPADRFVAGFIGSPAMNFFNGTIDGGPAFRSADGSWEVPLDPSWRSRLESWQGREVVLGVRPEHMTLTSDDRWMRATVDVVEPLGNEVLIYLVLKPGGPQYVARHSSDPIPAVGDVVFVAPRADKLHLFDAQTERAVR